MLVVGLHLHFFGSFPVKDTNKCVCMRLSGTNNLCCILKIIKIDSVDPDVRGYSAAMTKKIAHADFYTSYLMYPIIRT